MSFSTLTFLFVFLPIAWLVCFFTPKRGKKAVLLAVSLIFFAWGGIRDLVVLLCVIAFTYGTGLELMYQETARARRRELALAVAGLLLLLGVFKYTHLQNPLGLSFITFSAISYLVDLYRDPLSGAQSPADLAVYLSFFPKIASGPIVRFSAMKKEIRQPSLTRRHVTTGVELLLIGLCKKVLIADHLAEAFTAFSAGKTVAGAWLTVLTYGLRLYFDFSGYSDMAVGISRMFGFRSEENFRYPYLSHGFSDFWRRWHITLGTWFRDYVYFPLGGSRAGTVVTILNIMTVWVLTGIWHGSTVNYLLWGLYSGLWVLADHFFLRRHVKKTTQFLYVVFTDVIVFWGWIFFFSPTASSAFAMFGQLFGAGAAGIWESQLTFYLKEYLVFLIVGIAGTGPALKNLKNFLAMRGGKAAHAVLAVLYTALLVLCIAQMVHSTYSTFLYFRF